MQIRPASAGDYRFVEALWQEQTRHHAALEPELIREVATCISRRDYEEALRDGKREIAVVETAGGLQGFAVLVERRIDGGMAIPRAVAFIQEICVTHRARRNGVGRALMRYAEDWARQRQLTDIYLNVWASNTAALAFYRALGFSELRLKLSKPIDPAGDST